MGGREHRDSAGTCPGVHSGEPWGLHRGIGGLHRELPRLATTGLLRLGDEGAAKGPAPDWELARWGEVCSGKPGGLPRRTGGAAPGDREVPRGNGGATTGLPRAEGCPGGPGNGIGHGTRTAEAAPEVAPGGCNRTLWDSPEVGTGTRWTRPSGDRHRHTEGTPRVSSGNSAGTPRGCTGSVPRSPGGGTHRSPTWSRDALSPAAGAPGSDMAGPGAVGAASAARWDGSAGGAATRHPTASGADSTAPPPAAPLGRPRAPRDSPSPRSAPRPSGQRGMSSAPRGGGGGALRSPGSAGALSVGGC